MVAGIFEKSKRLRKALFFIVKILPQCQAQPCAAITRGMWGAHRAALLKTLLRTCLCRKTRRGARREESSRRRRARRFANLDLYLSRQFPSAVSVPPAHGTVPKLPCGSRPRLSEARGRGVKLDATTASQASQLEREYFLRLAQNLVRKRDRESPRLPDPSQETLRMTAAGSRFAIRHAKTA